MNTKIFIGLIIGLLLIIGYVLARSNTGYIGGNLDSMMKEGQTNVQTDTLNTMMPEGHTMPDGTVMQGEEMDTRAAGHMMPDGTMMAGTMPPSVASEPIPMDHSMMGHGSYEAYTAGKVTGAKTDDIVLFFRAAWCPTCKALDSDLKLRLMDIPQHVTILDVNYDTEIALKEKYGVTYQHTFVQVDTEGNQIAKWSGSRSLTELLTNIK